MAWLRSQIEIFLIDMTFWLGLGAVIIDWRDVFLANQSNARWAQMIMATVTTVVANRALALIGESDPAQTVQVDILLLAVCALLYAPLSRLFYVVAVVLTVLSAWALHQPSLSRLPLAYIVGERECWRDHNDFARSLRSGPGESGYRFESAGECGKP